MAWDRNDENLRIDLINFPEGCGFGGFEEETLWRGSARARDHALELSVEWDFEDPNACGGCEHDFSFELATVDFDPHALDHLRVRTRECTGSCDWVTYTLEFTGAQDGIRCAYAPIRDADPEDGIWGTEHMPADGGACLDDLQPFTVELAGELCLARCQTDDDCGLPDVETCREGLCQLTEAWGD